MAILSVFSSLLENWRLYEKMFQRNVVKNWKNLSNRRIQVKRSATSYQDIIFKVLILSIQKKYAREFMSCIVSEKIDFKFESSTFIICFSVLN